MYAMVWRFHLKSYVAGELQDPIIFLSDAECRNRVMIQNLDLCVARNQVQWN